MEQSAVSDKRRIAKNTGFLYLRMFIMLAVGLYTARVVLEALGETDYGIYNIIGGVVVLFSFINQSLTVATQRFLNFHLGKMEYDKMGRVFCMSMNAYIILSAVILVLGETVGLWFVNTQLNIPPDRMGAANWVYQLTLLTFIINVVRIPYNATIIAFERMDFYAYVSLFEVFAKLGIVYLLFITPVDRLVLYTALYTLFTFIVNLIYQVYSTRRFHTSRFKLMWDNETFKGLFTFSGWSLFGTLTNLTAMQGINILINIFFGVTVNAAVGIANNVSSHVKQFVSNFQTAFQPQIVKSYAAGEHEAFNSLVFQTTKFSYYLIFIISLPMMLTTNSLLNIWLTEVPDYTAIFCQLLLCSLLFEAMSGPLWMSVHATGDIRRHEIIMSCCFVLNFPLVYVAFKLGLAAYWAWIIRVVVGVFTIYVRFWYINKYLHFRAAEILKFVVWPITLVTLLSVPLPLGLALVIPEGWLQLLSVGALSVATSAAAIYFAGMSQGERSMVKQLLFSKILRKKSA